MSELKTRPSLEYQAFDGNWYPTQSEAEKVNRQWKIPYPAGISGPSLIKERDEWGDRTLLSCAGCRHFAVHTYDVYFEAQSEQAAGFLREYKEAVRAHTSTFIEHVCMCGESVAHKFKRLTRGDNKAVRPKDCPVYQRAEIASTGGNGDVK